MEKLVLTPAEQLDVKQAGVIASELEPEMHRLITTAVEGELHASIRAKFLEFVNSKGYEDTEVKVLHIDSGDKVKLEVLPSNIQNPLDKSVCAIYAFMVLFKKQSVNVARCVVFEPVNTVNAQYLALQNVWKEALPHFVAGAKFEDLKEVIVELMKENLSGEKVKSVCEADFMDYIGIPLKGPELRNTFYLRIKKTNGVKIIPSGVCFFFKVGFKNGSRSDGQPIYGSWYGNSFIVEKEGMPTVLQGPQPTEETPVATTSIANLSFNELAELGACGGEGYSVPKSDAADTCDSGNSSYDSLFKLLDDLDFPEDLNELSFSELFDFVGDSDANLSSLLQHAEELETEPTTEKVIKNDSIVDSETSTASEKSRRLTFSICDGLQEILSQEKLTPVQESVVRKLSSVIRKTPIVRMTKKQDACNAKRTKVAQKLKEKEEQEQILNNPDLRRQMSKESKNKK